MTATPPSSIGAFSVFFSRLYCFTLCGVLTLVPMKWKWPTPIGRNIWRTLRSVFSRSTIIRWIKDLMRQFYLMYSLIDLRHLQFNLWSIKSSILFNLYRQKLVIIYLFFIMEIIGIDFQLQSFLIMWLINWFNKNPGVSTYT